MYTEAKKASKLNGKFILSKIDLDSLSDYEQTMHGYINLINAKSLPISYVSDLGIRNFSRFNILIGRITLVKVTLKLVELVEKKIADELKGTKDAVLFDG